MVISVTAAFIWRLVNNNPTSPYDPNFGWYCDLPLVAGGGDALKLANVSSPHIHSMIVARTVGLKKVIEENFLD